MTFFFFFLNDMLLIAAVKGHVGEKSVDGYCTLTSQVTFIGLPWPGK